MIIFFIYFLFIQIAYFLWMGFINAITPKANNVQKFFTRITKFSVYFHEFTHYLIAKLLFQPVHLSDIVIISSNGLLRLKTRNPNGLTFMQAGMISLSPPFFSTIVLILLYRKILGYWGSNWGLTLLFIILAISILQVATPSFTDLKNVFSTLYHRPFSSIRQLMIVITGYLVYNHYYDEIMQVFSIIPEILFKEPIALILIIVIFEITVSLIFIFIKFVFSWIIKTGDFSNNYILNSNTADYREMAPTRQNLKKKKAHLSIEQELCNDLV